MPDESRALRGEAEEFSSFTFASLRRVLRDVSSPWIAAGARRDGHPIGLALGRMVEKERGLLDSIYVTPAFRREGVGKLLLNGWQQEASALGAKSLWVRFSESNVGLPSINALLDASRWGPAEKWLLKTFGQVSSLLSSGVDLRSVRRIRDNPTFEFAPLQFTMEDELRVEVLLAQSSAYLFSHPLKLLARYKPPFRPLPDVSLAVRRRGELVGWITAVLAGEDTARNLGLPPGQVVVEYPELYIDETIWRTGAGISAMIRAAEIQRKQFGEESVAVYVTNPATPAMTTLTMRRLVPHSIRSFQLMQRRKDLTQLL